MNYIYIVGIDPGTSTGIAVWDRSTKKITLIQTMKIHKAMALVALMKKEFTFFRVEDARKRKHFKNFGKERLQGAGSIKRDCTIWEDFLKDGGFHFEMLIPGRTKMQPDQFARITGISTRTSNHARDAGCLCFGY